MLKRMDLSGPWQARFSDLMRGRPHFAERNITDPKRYLPVTVPGDIHLDLMKLGMIGDVYRGANVLGARWVEEQIWSYRRTFDAPSEARQAGARAWLYFESLDYAARIVLNGQEVGRHANFFRPCRLEVTGLLRDQGNVLAVHLDSGLFAVADKPAAGYVGAHLIGEEPGPVFYSGPKPERHFAHHTDVVLHKRHWLRKPQSQFSWDWSQRLINVGIPGRVWLEHTSVSVRLDQLVPLITLSENLQQGQVRTRLFAENLLAEEQSGVLEIEVVEAGVKVSTAVTLAPGLHPVEALLTVPAPKLWWPVGQGEQPLYTLKTTLRVGATVFHAAPKRIGFRHVRVNQSPHPVSGTCFVLEVNHRPIFCKGANLVPADMLIAAIDRARYVTLVDRALEANFNFLRVWGGGLYEHDDFFDLCDEKGILVWQEFIYACARYPTTDVDFYHEAMREAAYQVRRLAAHPSLVIWCGNNENEVGAWDWGWMLQGVMAPDHAFYHVGLPRLLAQEDPTRYYQPSSPFSPGGRHPGAEDTGDQHPWSVGITEPDFRKYRALSCRFPNEGGFLGPTSLPTMLACLSEGQRTVQSFDWQLHDNSVDSWEEPSPIDRITEFWLGRDCRAMSVEEYSFWGGLLQGEALREYAETFRRRMFDNAAAIFWMYNDCWPAVRSWTIVDYYLRRTPSFHPVRRAFEPIRVVLVEEANEVVVYGINETASELARELRFGLFTISGEYPLDRKQAVRLPANASTRLAAFEKSPWSDPRRQVAFAVLEQGDRLVSRNRLILPLFKELAWEPAQVKVRLESGRALFESPTFAFNVCIDLSGEAVPDNFFDIYPGQPYALPWPGTIPPKVLYVGNLA